MLQNSGRTANKGRAYSPRKINIREPLSRFLIVCEGAQTEPNYFEGFRAPGLVIRIEGIGHNTLSLVKKTTELRKDEDYDQVWCVFDKDENSSESFNADLTLAARNNIQVAYSNEAFELCYLLHFDYINTGPLSIHRQIGSASCCKISEEQQTDVPNVGSNPGNGHKEC